MKAVKHACLVSLGLAAAVSQVLAAGPAEIVIPGEKLATESLTSTRDGTVYVGSVGTGQIFLDHGRVFILRNDVLWIHLGQLSLPVKSQ